MHDETQQQRQQVVDAQLEQLASSLDSTAGSLSGVLDDDASGHSAQRSISTLSSVSSIQLREHHIAAFSKLRTAAASGSKDAIPEEWKSYEPPSLVKGDWRSFGPTEAALTVIERNCGTEKHHVKHDRRKPSSLWRGTIWLTEVRKVFTCDPLSSRADLNCGFLAVTDTSHLCFGHRRCPAENRARITYGELGSLFQAHAVAQP